MTTTSNPPLRFDPVLGAALGLGTTAWYALPDVVRSRPARAVLKTLLAAGGTAALAATRPIAPATNGPDATDRLFHAVNENPGRAALVGSVLLGASTVATVWAEKAIFRLGERRRASGAPLAHTLPALALGALAAAAGAFDEPRARLAD